MCGTPFILNRPGSSQRYCSQRCVSTAQRRTDEHRCEWCGQPVRPHQRSCSRACLGILHRLDHNPTCPVTYGTCAACQRAYVKRAGRITCSPACSRQWNTQAVVRRYHDDPEYRARVIAAALNRYAGRLGAGEIRTPRALTLYLIERDHGICGICHQSVTETSGELGPSVDHIIPLRAAIGPPGEHSLGNIQLAHLRCNRRKGNRRLRSALADLGR